jgi:hypothetical protein
MRTIRVCRLKSLEYSTRMGDQGISLGEKKWRTAGGREGGSETDPRSAGSTPYYPLYSVQYKTARLEHETDYGVIQSLRCRQTDRDKQSSTPYLIQVSSVFL